MHKPVLISEVLEGLSIVNGGRYVDGTAGDGGHSEAILERLGPNGRLLIIDRDPKAIKRAESRLDGYASRCTFRNGNFSDVESIATDAGFDAVDGVLLDVGLSSTQLDNAERGFSFQVDGPLDMRMNQMQELTAKTILDVYTEGELTDMLRTLGEESSAKPIARAIVKARETDSIRSTHSLAELVVRAIGGSWKRTHPATKTFQALRIEVNDELGALRSGLEGGLNILKPGGRMSVISFHSLEDRIVKTFFREHAGRMESLQQGGEQWIGKEPKVRIVNKKPVVASDEEIESNPRSRSAKLRTAERQG